MNDKKYLKLNYIDAYKIASNLSNYVWDIVAKWGHFPKMILGQQFVEAVDHNEKANKRNLLKKMEYDHIFSELQKLPKSIHHLINYTQNKLSK